jgi:tetratricopeptide (TPR) repeat protein
LFEVCKDYFKKEELNRVCLKINPENSSALLGKGSAYYFSGDYTTALLYYKEAFAKDPTNNAAISGIEEAKKK